MSSQFQSKQTEIGLLPKEWEVIRLENVIEELKNGFASGKRDDKGIVQIRMNNVTTDGKLVFSSYIKVPIPPNIDDFILREKDFLFNNTNSYELVGKPTIFKETPYPCSFSNHFTRIRFKEGVLPEWVLFHFISLWRRGYFKSVAIRHVGQSAVQTKFIKNILIPLPPLPEQKKIAEILSTADEAIQAVDEAIAKTNRLKKGLMQELLSNGIGHEEFKETEIGRIPKEWEVVSLGDISTDSFGGGTPSTKNPEYWNGDIAWMTSAHINGPEVKTGQRYITKEGLRNSASSLVPKDNLLVATRVGIGKAAVNKIDIAISQDLTGIILDKNKSTPDFIFWFITNNPSKLKSLAQGSTIKGLLRDRLLKLKLPLPSLPEQQKIAEILSTVDNKLELLREEKGKFERIKQGLMNDLLTGKRRVKGDILSNQTVSQLSP